MRDCPNAGVPVTYTQAQSYSTQSQRGTPFYNVPKVVPVVDFRTAMPNHRKSGVLGEIMDEVDTKEVVLGQDQQPVALSVHYVANGSDVEKEAFEVDKHPKEEKPANVGCFVVTNVHGEWTAVVNHLGYGGCCGGSSQEHHSADGHRLGAAIGCGLRDG